MQWRHREAPAALEGTFPSIPAPKHIDTSGFGPLSKQQADTFPVVCSANALRDHGANINSNKLAAGGLVLILWDRIGDLIKENNFGDIKTILISLLTTKRSIGNSLIKLMLASDSSPKSKG